MNNNRGYFGIGIYHPKTEVNIGTLWRNAYIFGASFIFTIGKRYKKQASDTLKTYRHIPLWNYEGYNNFLDNLPYDCMVVCVELSDKAILLAEFKHPQRAVYLLGAEDNGIPAGILKDRKTIQIPSQKPYCLNVSVAGSIVMYDRIVKGKT